MKRRVLITAFSWSAAIAQSQGLPPLDAATLRARVSAMAHDSTLGRLAGSEQAATVQRSLAQLLASFGAQSLWKNGGLLQDVRTEFVRLSDASELFLTPNPYDKSFGVWRASFGPGNDFLPLIGLRELRFPRRADDREARVIFGGAAWRHESHIPVRGL